MRIDKKIKSIVEQIEGLNFEFNDWTRANITLDTKNLPACLYLLPISGNLKIKNGFAKDQPNALIAFLDKAELDFNGDTNEPTVERMKNFAIQFIKVAKSSEFFEPLPDFVPYSVVYDKLDVNVTGIVLQLQLKESEGKCIKF
jgi:hypothetical protein